MIELLKVLLLNDCSQALLHLRKRLQRRGRKDATEILGGSSAADGGVEGIISSLSKIHLLWLQAQLSPRVKKVGRRKLDSV